MKGLSIYNLDIKEKKINSITGAWFNYLLQPSRLGLYWFLILFFTIFLLETSGYLITGKEMYQFDELDLLLASAGFIFGFFAKFFENFQKKKPNLKY